MIVDEIYGNINNAPLTYIYPDTLMVDNYCVYDIQVLTYSQEKVPVIQYCRKHVIFPNTWSAWLNPSHWTVWLAIITFIVAASLQKMAGTLDVNLFLFEMYFILSYLLRQPVKNFTVLHALTVLSCLIIPLVYESLVVGEVIAPPKPTEYHNVAEFLDHYEKKILPTNTDYAEETVLGYEFVKFNVTNKYENRVEIVQKMDLKYHQVIEFLKETRKKVGVVSQIVSQFI